MGENSLLSLVKEIETIKENNSLPIDGILLLQQSLHHIPNIQPPQIRITLPSPDKHDRLASSISH